MQTSSTSIIPTARRSLAVEWERHWCSAVGLIMFVFFYVYAGHFFEDAERYHWHVDNLYCAIFGLATFAAALLFSVYAYVRTTENKILDAIRQSIYFARASKYIVVAIITTSALSVLTIPLFVTVPEIKSVDLSYLIFCGWAAFTVYAGALSGRSLYHFITILNSSSPKRR
jgi:hypothetical protein